ncbi:MAG: penicillin acylase family protein [Aureispira sp.]
MKKIILYILFVLVLLLGIGAIYIYTINNFTRDGSFEIVGNEQPIQIHRDEHGIPYIFAQNKPDAIRGQGFITAQDRLFQIEFYRALIKGELAAFIGPSMLQSDIKMRVLNLQQNAKKNYSYLNKESKDFLTWYCEGFNEYLRVGKGEFPVELTLLNITAKDITPEEMVAIIHFIGLNHGKNMEDEVLSLNLAAHTDFAPVLLPLNVNPDRTKPLVFQADSLLLGFSEQLSKELPVLESTLLPAPKLGSNNWALSGSKSKSGIPILCNDPHLDARLLPGIFHPVGLFCPSFKGVGLAIPGIPGLVVGRNEKVAFGVTNAYGDSQDLFIEKVEGDFYEQNGEKLPLKKRQETIVVKGGVDVQIEVRSTSRGPIISDFDVFGIRTKDIVSLRWSLAESKNGSLGIEHFLEAENVFQFRAALTNIDNMFFNFVMADTDGNIAHQATGLIPKRIAHQGAVPQVVQQQDSWFGFIPKTELPHSINPKKGWVGTANHDTRPDDYPYYYSAHFSPNYRYSRVKELLLAPKKWTAEECWDMILDCKNKQAEQLSPIFATALALDNQTKDLALILQEWTHHDDIHEVGATVYNVLYNELLNLILDDELPDEIEEAFWENQYYWTQKIDSFIQSNHPFIDNIHTDKKEGINDLVIAAGIKTKEFLSKELGTDQKEWTWGRIHSLKFVSPIKQKGFGSGLLGAEEFPKRGSNQTLNRGGYTKQKEKSFETAWFSTFRMVADLDDKEKIRGVLSGGSTARIFHPYYKSQLEKWKNEEWIPYWLSEDKIVAHSKHLLLLK